MSTTDQMFNIDRSQHNGFYEVQLPVIAETEKAICFNKYRGYLDKELPVWVPKSQMKIYESVEAGRRYFVKEWLGAKNKLF